MKSVQSVTYGAMSVGLLSLVLLLDRLFVGNLGFMMSIIIPLPLVLYGTKFTLKESVVVYLTMIVASFIFNGMPPAMVSVAGFGFVGLVMIYTHKQEYGFLRKNILLFLSMVVIYAIMIYFFSGYFGLSISKTIDTLKHYLPGSSVTLMYFITWLSIVMTIFMELYILNTSVKLLTKRLNKHLRK